MGACSWTTNYEEWLIATDDDLAAVEYGEILKMGVRFPERGANHPSITFFPSFGF